MICKTCKKNPVQDGVFICEKCSKSLANSLQLIFAGEINENQEKQFEKDMESVESFDDYFAQLDKKQRNK